MSKYLPDYSNTNILVVGDVMLDRYWTGKTQRISPEAPVPIVHVNATEERPGGAGNVARSITALEGNCTLVGLLGEDDYGVQLQKLLTQENVNLKCITDPGSETVTKLRVLSLNQQLIRLDFENEFSAQSISQLTDYVCGAAKEYNIILLSDYQKGALADIRKIIEQAKVHNIPVFVDPKGKDFSKYQGVTAITPNQSEFAEVVGGFASESEIVEKGVKLLKELDLEALVITRSEKGVTLIEKSSGSVNIPARAKEVFDVTGAGDTFISVLAASYAAGSSFAESVDIANAAASVVVGKLGAAVVNKTEIEQELNGVSQAANKILDKHTVADKISELRANGKKIVMTNGCFDILHSGHVEYLSKAKEFGDVLIVAVNSDESVNRIKGAKRPVNSLQSRLNVLAALQSVDILLAFDQDTPADLVSVIVPDILVKGGDYSENDVVGGNVVRKNGGEVKIVDYVESFSTSEIIAKIKDSSS